ncbi:MAG: LemA family protein [Eggerthellaceae bacterium]|jgi:LemA protein
MEAGIVILVIVIVLAIIAILLYNNLVTLRNRVGNAWTQISVQLQRRLDLIPNLVETVKGYAAHERGTFEAVTKARTAVMNASTPDEQAAADNMLTDCLKNLFAVAEAYPDLKANQNFLELQRELTETEDKISYMRQSYNDTVMTYNNAIQTFPGLLVAKPFGFKEKAGFSAAAQAATAPSVAFTPDAETASNAEHAPGTARQAGPDVEEAPAAPSIKMQQPPDA